MQDTEGRHPSVHPYMCSHKHKAHATFPALLIAAGCAAHLLPRHGRHGSWQAVGQLQVGQLQGRNRVDMEEGKQGSFSGNDALLTNHLWQPASVGCASQQRSSAG